MPDHPLALPSGTVLGAVSPDDTAVEYLHAAVDDQLAAAGVLTGDENLTTAVWATLYGDDSFIDGDTEVVFLHCLAEVHPTGISVVVPTARWFLAGDRDSLPDLAIAMAAVMPTGSVLSVELNGYLRAIENYGDECALLDG